MNTFAETEAAPDVAEAAVEQEIKPKRVRKPKAPKEPVAVVLDPVTGQPIPPEPKVKRHMDTEKFRLDAKITVLSAENPKRVGSRAHRDWEQYQTGMTVLEVLQKDVIRADLIYNASHGFISIEGYDAPAPKARPKKVKAEMPEVPAPPA
jgi:hypothetical protein